MTLSILCLVLVMSKMSLTNAVEGMCGQKSYTVGGTVNRYNHYQEQYRDLLKTK